MSCDCNSSRIAHISAKCSDMCNVRINDIEHNGYAPFDMKIGGGDYISFRLCLNCGKVQGNWPLARTNIENGNQEFN